MRKKLIPPVDLDGWTIVEEESDAVYLDAQEIEAIYQLELPESSPLRQSRNEFVLGCLTGLRFSDFSAIERVDWRNGRLYKKQKNQNTGSLFHFAPSRVVF